MHSVAKVLATLLVVFVVGVLPFLGRYRYRQLVKGLASDPSARRRHYVCGIVSEWAYVGVVVVIVALGGGTASSIGLTWHNLKPGGALLSVEFVVVVAIGLVVTTLILRRAGPKLLARFRRQVQPFVELIPRTREERLVFGALAVTAGICEEILFRGFGIMYFHWMFPGTGSAVIVLCIGASFGLAHLYQGLRNVILIGVLGCVFTSVAVASGTIVAVIVVHALVDLRVLFLPSSLVASPEMAKPPGTIGPY